MPDADPIRDSEDEFGDVEREILYQLTTPEDGQPLWSIEDLNREMDRKDVTDYVLRLHSAGLIHKTSDGFVFASRAAVRVVQMIGHVA